MGTDYIYFTICVLTFFGGMIIGRLQMWKGE